MLHPGGLSGLGVGIRLGYRALLITSRLIRVSRVRVTLSIMVRVRVRVRIRVRTVVRVKVKGRVKVGFRGNVRFRVSLPSLWGLHHRL